jgi:tripartite-type tricarboxylate transporter receptor subunit TctC
VADLLGGQVQVTFESPLSSIEYIRSGKLRALAVGTSKRIGMMPELPTISELGFPGFDVSLWMGLLVPARTPADIVDKLAQETARILNEPTMRAKLEAQGAEPAYRSPAAFSAFIADETKRFSQIVDDIKLRVD